MSLCINCGKPLEKGDKLAQQIDDVTQPFVLVHFDCDNTKGKKGSIDGKDRGKRKLLG